METLTDLLYCKPGQKPSLTLRMFHYLLDGNELSTITGLREFHTTETRKQISILRSLGVKVKDRWVRLPNGKQHKIYWIPEQDQQLFKRA
jgi:hypothetical protein